jgi:hypothetical protein
MDDIDFSLPLDELCEYALNGTPQAAARDKLRATGEIGFRFLSSRACDVIAQVRPVPPV